MRQIDECKIVVEQKNWDDIWVIRWDESLIMLQQADMDDVLAVEKENAIELAMVLLEWAGWQPMETVRGMRGGE